jgi:hypothetical protein
MKLIAEIDGQEGEYPIRLTCDGNEWLIVQAGSFESTRVPLDEFRKALDAVAPPNVVTRPFRLTTDQAARFDEVLPPAPAPTRAPDGSRIGESPRFKMRARPAPEADAPDLPQEDTAA